MLIPDWETVACQLGNAKSVLKRLYIVQYYKHNNTNTLEPRTSPDILIKEVFLFQTCDGGIQMVILSLLQSVLIREVTLYWVVYQCVSLV